MSSVKCESNFHMHHTFRSRSYIYMLLKKLVWVEKICLEHQKLCVAYMMRKKSTCRNVDNLKSTEMHGMILFYVIFPQTLLCTRFRNNKRKDIWTDTPGAASILTAKIAFVASYRVWRENKSDYAQSPSCEFTSR